MEHGATSSGHALLFCGTLRADDFASGDFSRRLLGELSSRRRKLTKEDNVKGFQRTPAFVHAVVLDVLEAGEDGKRGAGAGAAAEAGRQPRRLAWGGFTDVGQHTGSHHRDIAWPLLCQTILVSGEPS
jgi:hypothetical protein